MTDLTPDQMLDAIKRALAENSARFHPKIIVSEGMAAWGALRSLLIEGLERSGGAATRQLACCSCFSDRFSRGSPASRGSTK